MDWLNVIGLREAVIIYGIILGLFLVSMLSAQPKDKPKKLSPVILVVFIAASTVFVVFVLLNLRV